MITNIQPAKPPYIREHDCPVSSNEWVNDQYKHLILDAPSDVVAQTSAGQFFHLLCPQVGKLTPFFRRPMSVYRYDSEHKQLHFLYKVTGVGTTTLSQLRIGDTLNIFGPLGTGFTLEPEWQNLLLLARGVGLATLAPLAKAAQQSGKQLHAICSARSDEYLLSADYFRSMGVHVYPVLDTDGSSSMHNVEQLIVDLINKNGIDAFFTCGSRRMLKLLQKLGKQHDIVGQVALEQQMACGLGMCYCCVRTFTTGEGGLTDLRVCKTGPVFDLQRAIA